MANSDVDDSAANSGNTTIKAKAADRIVDQAVHSVPGTTNVDGGLLSRNFPRFDVRLDHDQQVASVDATIAVSWPSPATRVATEVRTAIAQALETYTGYRVTRVNVSVGEAVASSQRITRDDLARRVEPSPKAISVGEIKVAQPQVSSSLGALADIEIDSSSHILREVTVTPAIGELTEIRSRDISTTRDVETPWPTPLEPIAVADATDLTPVSVPPTVPLREVAVNELQLTKKARAPKQRQAWKPSAPEPTPPREVAAPTQQPLREVSVPQPAALRDISVRELNHVEVKAPEPQKLREPKAPKQPHLAKVQAPRPLNVYSPRAPKPQPLRKVGARPIPSITPQPPKKRTLRKVSTPKPRQLAKVHAPEDHPFRQVITPQPAPLREIYLRDSREAARDLKGDRRGN